MARERTWIKKLKIPYYNDGSGDKGKYEVNTLEEKRICEYTGYDFDRLDDLEVFEYWLLLRDAVIYGHMQSEGGMEYLDNCYRMEQVKPQRNKLREKFGKK